MQERLTGQIADAVMRKLKPRGVIVVVEAEHLCMAMRGVRKAGCGDDDVCGAWTVQDRQGISSRGAGSHPAQVMDDMLGMGPTVVMGVVNVTDDSFSDGGRFLDADRAVEHGLALVSAGACIIDVGGESTRPGATRVDPAVETARILPVVKGLVAQGVTVRSTQCARRWPGAALEHGARVVNDVSGWARRSGNGAVDG